MRTTELFSWAMRATLNEKMRMRILATAIKSAQLCNLQLTIFLADFCGKNRSFAMRDGY